MVARHASKAALIEVDKLHVPEAYETKVSKVEDDLLLSSVQLTGIQQPLIIVEVDLDTYFVVDGVRRLNIAIHLDMELVPCVMDYGIEDVDVKDRDEYRNRIRFIVDEHRQDLLPTQRSKLIRQLQSTFDMTSREVGLYLGVTSGTIANWTLIEKVIPEIQRAIDGGQLKVHTARAFAGMSESGQRTIWEGHQAEIFRMNGTDVHKWIRETFSPTESPDMYKSPKVVASQLAREGTNRKGRKRSIVSKDEKKGLLKDFETKKIEIEDKKHQIGSLEKDIHAAIPVIEAILEHEDLLSALPEGMEEEFREFAERYI